MEPVGWVKCSCGKGLNLYSKEQDLGVTSKGVEKKTPKKNLKTKECGCGKKIKPHFGECWTCAQKALSAERNAVEKAAEELVDEHFGEGSAQRVIAQWNNEETRGQNILKEGDDLLKGLDGETEEEAKTQPDV